MKTKIIFLDIDGVLATDNDYGRRMDNKWGAYMFDEKCVKVLNEILEISDAEIVLSSDWKRHYSLSEIREFFEFNGIIKKPIGFTPSLPTYTGDNLEGGRSDEIQQWIKQHNVKDDLIYVVVDDLDLSVKYGGISGNYISGFQNFVHCKRTREGIKQTGIKEKILKYLQIKEKPCKFDHNGECLICDCWSNDCAYMRMINKDYKWESKEELEEMFKDLK